MVSVERQEGGAKKKVLPGELVTITLLCGSASSYFDSLSLPPPQSQVAPLVEVRATWVNLDETFGETRN